MAPVRVLWLTKGLGPGGAEHLLLALASARDPERVAYEAAYLLPWKQHLVPALEAAGVRTHLLEGPRDIDLRWTSRLRRLLVSERFDVVHAHSPVPAAMARVVVRSLPAAARPRFVTTEHNEWDSYRPATRTLGRLTFRFDDHRLAVAEAIRASLPPRFARTTEVLVHGVDAAAVRAAAGDRAEVRTALGVSDDDLLVCSIANLRKDKDHATLIAALDLTMDRVPNVRAVAVGQGDLEPEVRALASRMAHADRVAVLGYRPDARAILAASDVLVLSSRREGLPVVIMEALTLGRPVVATDVGGVRELIRDGIEGRLVPPGDPTALASALIEVLTNDDTRAAMASAALVRSELVDIHRASKRLEDLYAKLTK